MHLLQAQPGTASDGSEAVDLQQTPADIVVLSAADSELSALARARAELGEGFPSLRLANLMQLGHPMSVDLYLEKVVCDSRLVIVRLLGGVGYWTYGVEQLRVVCEEREIPLALLSGDDQPDAELARACTVEPQDAHRLWQYCVHGGAENARSFLCRAAGLLGRRFPWMEPRPVAPAGLYWPQCTVTDLTELRQQWHRRAPVAAVVFYRALYQASNLEPVDALIRALEDRGINALPLYCASLKDPVSAELVTRVVTEAKVELVLNATGFAVGVPGSARAATPFDGLDCPVIQVVFSGGNEDGWRSAAHGLSARDIAMNVALPEVDGRVLSRAVSFKAEDRFDPATQCSIVAYRSVPDRVAFVADLTRRWLELRSKPPRNRRIALVLANYPNRDGRLGNGVGLDTPASAVKLLAAMKVAGYAVRRVPRDGDALIARLASGPTNQSIHGRTVREQFPLAHYRRRFEQLPVAVREAVLARWGSPRDDPLFLTEGAHGGGAFAVPAFRCGEIVVGLQPARGYHIDPTASYHDPALVPPHGYFAFYFWLRDDVNVHAVVHLGKHGNLEWLPGKALALSEECFPEAALGPLPHLYPFIVNDPGEGSQAKRRAQAVIVDHLTPPLTRAETYGPLADLERLVDEYYEAAGVDPRRLKVLRRAILDQVGAIGLDRDCGIDGGDDPDQALAKLDAYLCELKEMQIRDGLHVFGASPVGEQLTDSLVALARLPRGDAVGGNASLIRALAADLGLHGFDPLDCDMAERWTGPCPDALAGNGAWRTRGDTVERLEHLARDLVSGVRSAPSHWAASSAVLQDIETILRPAVQACGEHETAGLLAGLDGRFVPPGPSGAPTRGRPEVLPTGRNFYSVDTRTVPTPAAWQLGWKSAARLVERYRQENGAWPRRLALSAWGTSNMRTGGDDLAQGLALLGVRPKWDAMSRRVTGFEVLPTDLLDRPRVDVTLRVSGFFRDAFPAQIDLFDSAVRAVAALSEPEELNPLAARVRGDARALVCEGVEPQLAERRAAYRVFGSKPGAYGAGLQALIDERGWRERSDLAKAYVAWGGYAYGGGAGGLAEHALFEARLRGVELVVHNQDNREHDLLDSDDYYQFEGGLAASVAVLSGRDPHVFHTDHSRPDSPRVRTLEEEIARVVRARVVNPKWIRGVMRHGYKGAFEMAATVDYLFAFAATAHAVADHHFDAVYDAYLADTEVRSFLHAHNPAALAEMAERLVEAQDRALWRPRSNSARDTLTAIASRAGGHASSEPEGESADAGPDREGVGVRRRP